MNFFLLFLLIFSFQVESKMEILVPWSSNSNPRIMNPNFEKKFSKLPLEGEVSSKTRYWSSDYWPLNKGNINIRWYSQNPVGFNLTSPTKEEALKMSQEELKALAPSEKFDLLRGSYDYPLRKEVERRSSPRRRDWEGICHGWAMAALNHAEPVPRVLRNPDGLQVPFGSSDIKALLSYYYAYKFDPRTTHQMGKRCNGRRNCYREDLNAGAFHVVLANRIGLEGLGFIADIEHRNEVWNQVVTDYSSEVIEKDLKPLKDSAKGTKRVVRLKTKMRVAFNIKANSWDLANGTPLQTFKDLDYEYDLDLGSEDKIIGGKWRSKVRPDFLWLVENDSPFGGDFGPLNRLLIKGHERGP